jgi:hypothetical protein
MAIMLTNYLSLALNALLHKKCEAQVIKRKAMLRFRFHIAELALKSMRIQSRNNAHKLSQTQIKRSTDFRPNNTNMPQQIYISRKNLRP